MNIQLKTLKKSFIPAVLGALVSTAQAQDAAPKISIQTINPDDTTIIKASDLRQDGTTLFVTLAPTPKTPAPKTAPKVAPKAANNIAIVLADGDQGTQECPVVDQNAQLGFEIVAQKAGKVTGGKAPAQAAPMRIKVTAIEPFIKAIVEHGCAIAPNSELQPKGPSAPAPAPKPGN